MLARIRKAIVAGAAAGLAATLAVEAKSGWHVDHATLGQDLGAFVAAAAVAAYATWRTPNAK